jgi:multimeric flavodoxin WrbA
LLAADAYLFATPEMLGSMAGRMKDFFDRCYYPALDTLAGRAYALIVCAGSDGHGAVRQLQRIGTGWRLRLIAEPLVVCTHAQTPQAIAARKQIEPGSLEKAGQLGASLASGLALGLW